MKYYFCALVLLLGFNCEAISRSNISRRASDPNHAFCGTYRGRVYDELRKARQLQKLREARGVRLSLSQARGASQDINNIAVIDDDGSIITPATPFDLDNLDLKLTPNGSGSYTLARQAGTINQNFGTKLPLTDDDFRQISFQGGFQFPFFGTNYSSVFINSDGNITFTQGDAEHTDRDLARFNGGVPRIAPLFNDLDPTIGQGGVFYNQLPDRFLITWKLIREFGGVDPSTFQVALFPDGSFEFTYGVVSVGGGIVGWSRGGNLQNVSLIDLSKQSGSSLSGPVAEQFSQQTEVDNTALAKKFYETHADDFDQLAFFSNFDFDLGSGAFSYEVTLKNDIQGINVDPMDFSGEFGSQGNLESFIAIHNLSDLPDDPDAIVNRTYSTAKTVAHETAHRWLAYPRFRDGSVNSNDLLGYQLAHWSFFFNADASLMEGNLIQDNRNGSFTIKAATNHYSKLDQYLMGLRSAPEVEPLFYVKQVSGTSHVASDVTDLPDIGLTFRGTRRSLSVFDIIAAEGPRVPDVLAAPRVWRQAFILLVRQGTSPTSAEIDKLSRLQRRVQEFYAQATDGLGMLDISLSISPPLISSVTPAFGSTQGNTQIYISGSNFQPGATVTLGTVSAANVQVVSPSLIIATTAAGAAGAANVVVTNPGAQPTTLSNAFTYRNLTPATVSSNALRIYIVDSLYFRSNLGINNPNPGATNVRILQVDRNGLLVNQLDSISIPPNGYVQKNSLLRLMEGTTGPSGREGSLVLEADQPIQAFVSQIDNLTNDPNLLDGVRQGASRLILQSAANTSRFQSNLVVLNLSSSQARVNITALNRDTGQPDGVPLVNLTIAGNGFMIFDNILKSLALSETYGPVEIRSTNGTLLAAVSRNSGVGTNTSGFFVAQAADSGSLTEFIPFAVDTDALRTNVGLNNLGTALANVDVALIGADGGTRAATSSPIQVAPGGMVQINQVLRFLLNGSSNSNVTQQQGYLKITSNQPVKAFATQIDNVSLDPSIENSVSAGSSHLLLKSSAQTNFQSTLVVVNNNTSPVAVTIQARQGADANNGLVTGTRTINIPANGFFYSNNILHDLGASSLFGPIEIRTANDLPVIAVSRVYSTGGYTSGFFNAQPIP